MTISWRFETLLSTESTNSDLLNRWHQQLLQEPTSLMAFEQTAGRGKRGKNWISEKGRSLTFSMAYPFSSEFSMMKLQGITLVCGLAILKALLEYLQLTPSMGKKINLGLKWPNDILLDGRKLGGILVEGGQKSINEPFWMIIGVGLNLGLPRQSTENLETANIEEMNRLNIPLELASLWQFLTSKVSQTLEIFSEKSFSEFQEEWNSWDCWQNHQLLVKQNDKVIHQGKNCGVNHSGYLILETPLGLQEISSGDLSIVQQKP